MSARMLCLALLAIIGLVSVGGAAGDQLPVAFCTPENSKCSLASDGNLASCFAAGSLQENFYFAVFNTVGQSVSVDKLVLHAGRSVRTNYTVSLANGYGAHNLKCSDAKKATESDRVIECPADTLNVTSMMVRSEPLMTRLSLLEVEAFGVEGGRVNFTYCVSQEAQDSLACRNAMDGLTAADSPTIVTETANFPSWYGGVAGTEQILTVKIHRPAGNAKATFYRIRTTDECKLVAESIDAGVQVIEYRCSGYPVNLVQVFEIDSDFLMTLCEIQVYGQ